MIGYIRGVNIWVVDLRALGVIFGGAVIYLMWFGYMSIPCWMGGQIWVI